MTTYTDLFYSILAMDAYNKGYEPHIAGLDNRQIGNATQISGTNNPQAQSIGFYGVAYEWQNQTIISFRGTSTSSIGAFLDDAANGYWIGAGTFLGEQAELAIDFYKSVAGQDPFNSSVSLTGHSLGGGLAGLVAGLYGKDAIIFNNMAFALAVDNAYQRSNYGASLLNNPNSSPPE